MMMNIKRQDAFAKHVPQRTCVACRQIRAKRDLVRLVLCSDGTVCIDCSGKRSGRGAYLCWKEDCWEAGIKGKKLERSLGASIRPENRELLVQYGKNLHQEIANDQGNKGS